MSHRYIITDCTGQIAGNPDGYKTMASALAVANNRKTAAHRQLREAFDSVPRDMGLVPRGTTLYYRVEGRDHA